MVAWIKAVLILGSLIVITGIKLFLPSYEDDNSYEEIAEQVIKMETGVDIDLTPLSPKNNNNDK